MRLRLKNILRNIHQHRARTPASGEIECFVNYLRQVCDVLDQEVVFGAGAGDPESIRLLKRIGANQFGRDLPRKSHHRDRIHHGIHQAGNQVGSPGSRGRATHTYAAG